MPGDDRPSWDDTWLDVAADVARRSLCVRDQVGAVIVDYQNRIVSTGYNGPPQGFSHDGRQCRDWCARAQLRKSSEYEIVRADGVIVSGERAPDYSDCPALHAEANALMVCDRSVREGGTIYVTSHVCFTCAKLIANSGLERVVVRPRHAATHRDSPTGYVFLERCGIVVEVLDVL